VWLTRDARGRNGCRRDRRDDERVSLFRIEPRRQKEKTGKAGWKREATGGATEMAEERRTGVARRVPLAAENIKGTAERRYIRAASRFSENAVMPAGTGVRRI
jgi:hypothetical protein